jgi:hypothetical protein
MFGGSVVGSHLKDGSEGCFSAVRNFDVEGKEWQSHL